MRVVLDTNILLSALINRHGTPAQLIAGWRERRRVYPAWVDYDGDSIWRQCARDR